MGALGEWVLDRLCRHASDWRDLGLHPSLSFNLSPASCTRATSRSGSCPPSMGTG